MAEGVLTRDAFFDGSLMLTQPALGHRSGTDAVLLAASLASDFAGRVIDVGAGVGAVGLGVALVRRSTHVVLLDVDPKLTVLAADNAAANGLADRVETRCGDLFDPAVRRDVAAADVVLTNPPFYEADRIRLSTDPGRRAAHVLAPGHSLADWIEACLALVAAKGEIVAIAPAAALAALLAPLAGGAGNIAIKTVHSRVGQPARRVLVRARKGSRAPLTITAPLILHDGDLFTPQAEALHRGVATLAW